MKLTTYLTTVVLTATTLFSSGALAAGNAVETPCADCELQYWNCWDICAEASTNVNECKPQCDIQICERHPECQNDTCGFNKCLNNSSSDKRGVSSVANYTVKATPTVYNSQPSTSVMTTEVPGVTAASENMVGPPPNPCFECQYLTNICKRRCEEEGSSPEYCNTYCRTDICAAYKICRDQCGFEECTRRRDVKLAGAIASPASTSKDASTLEVISTSKASSTSEATSTFKTEVSQGVVQQTPVIKARADAIVPVNPCLDCQVLFGSCSNERIVMAIARATSVPSIVSAGMSADTRRVFD
ncbi:hypothetical protein BLS_003115 [Venturia inaequalis]|uniref:Uncharacterized protein n=1 Tax=Venturia inaequalis TaxID=5025 RepID=A0A8H3USI3_VENIN|nr:hypothetical protein BLS_003115 [Venturia inaequalis]